MNKQEMIKIAEAYKAQMKAIDNNFPVTEQAQALSVWTQMSPMDRCEVMSMVEKMPKSLAAKQNACLKKIVEMIK